MLLIIISDEYSFPNGSAQLVSVANSSNGWDSSPPCKWYGLQYPSSEATVTRHGPSHLSGGHQVNRHLKSCAYRGAQKD